MESSHSSSSSSSSSEEKKMMIQEPLLINRNPKGGLRTLPFIIANEAFERMASNGLMPNMILYLCRQYNMETTAGTNVLFIWSAATNFLPIVGAFLADSCVGRYPMIGFGCITSFLGMILLWLTTIFPQAQPPACDQAKNSFCPSATAPQLLFLYSSFALMSIGAGGIRASCLAFGADQLKKRDTIKNAGALQSYFNWYYVSVNIASMVAVTGIVYIQDNLGWKVGFGIPSLIMLFSALCFFLATPFYIKLKAKTSLLTGLIQVPVASFKNHRRVNVSSRATDEMYHCRKGSTLVMPSENLRWLNEACVINNREQDLSPDGKASNPWSLCTIDQVEEFKSLIKIIPMWSTGILYAVNISQNSFLVLQASAMDRHITPGYEFPAGSFMIFPVIAVTLWISFYDRVILPLASKIKGKPCQLSVKQRMGIGLLCSTASLASWAIVESIRRQIAINEGITDDPQAVVKMSAMWLLPYLILSGLAMAFNMIGQTEFYYSELPKSMSSIATTLLVLGMSAGSLVASFIMNAVDGITKRGGGGNEGWIPSNINKGHYDYYYWLLAGLNMANFIYFLGCSKAYGPCKGQQVSNKVFDEKEGMEEDDC